MAIFISGVSPVMRQPGGGTLAHVHYFSYIELSSTRDLRTNENADMSKAKAQAGAFVDDYLPALLAQASHLISGEFHRIVTSKGFTVSDWRVLASLDGAEPMSIGTLARVTTMKQPTLTRVVDRLQARGHVRRIAHETDRRVTLIEITAAGDKLVAGLIDLAKEHEHRVLEPFGLARSNELKKTLKQMIEMHADLALDAGGDDEE
jgi:DNA-binding MarR family transcriptional regulator